MDTIFSILRSPYPPLVSLHISLFVLCLSSTIGGSMVCVPSIHKKKKHLFDHRNTSSKPALLLFCSFLTVTMVSASCYKIYSVQLCLFWFRREGGIFQTVARLPSLGSNHGQDHLVKTDSRHRWWTLPEHGTLVFTLIKWNGLWGQTCSGPCLGP